MAVLTVYPGLGTYPSTSLFPADPTAAAPRPHLPAATMRELRPATQVHIGELLTGRITATVPVVGLGWTDVLNGNGTIDATITEDIVRAYDLRHTTQGVRSFLAVEVDNRIKVAGPIWSRTWDWEKGQLTLGAAGMWSYMDHRLIYPLNGPANTAEWKVVVENKSFGGIARALVDNMIVTMFPQTLPIVLPADELGDHTETFPMWSMLTVGEQLRQITQRAVDAPDIRFQPRRKASDPRFIEWVMQIGTVDRPALYQGGGDWVFDSSAKKSAVLGITTDEDATEMAELVFATGNGQEEGTKIAFHADATLLDLGWPLTESKESYSTVEEQATLDGHAANYLQKVARPIEVLKVRARADAFGEVLPGDYARTITRGDVWLGDMDMTTRIKQVSGGLSDDLQFDMFSVQAAL